MATQPPPAPSALANPTPKARFLQTASNITQHRQMVDSAPFIRAIDFALLHYQTMLGDQTRDAQTAMASGTKLQGALEFVTQLRMLSETQTPIPRRDTGNLDH